MLTRSYVSTSLRTYYTYISTSIQTVWQMKTKWSFQHSWRPTKSLFPKFQLIPILRFEVMHDYVCFIAPMVHFVELSLMYKTFCESCSHFILKWFQPYSFWGIVLLRGELQKYAKNSNLKNFESTVFIIREYAFGLWKFQCHFWVPWTICFKIHILFFKKLR